ncbi:MAG TPA: APC family permease, partial [Cyclobacteriaceae bacterium]|nr:APC family permease [Cyclobacteriaceae bacterium]
MSQQKNELKKVLGAGFGIAVMVGGTIGVGILRTPGTIAGMLDSYWLILACWAFGGIYVLLGAGSFAEMAVMLPKAGGPYNYVKRAFGDYAGFLSGWFDYILNAIAPAYFCIVIGEYMALLFPALKGNETIMALGFLVLFFLYHLSGVKSGSIAQQVTSVLKVLFFTVLIVSCFVVKVDREAFNQTAPLFEGGILIGFLKSIQLVMGAYNGWWSNSFFAEEDENPAKNIPKSLFTGGILVMAIYVILNVAFMYVLPIGAVANSPLVASEVTRVVFGDSGAAFVTVISIVSLVSILNAYMMIPPRILFGLSRDGFFIPQGTAVNKGGTPVVALVLSGIISFALITVGSFQQLFSLASFMSIVVMALSFSAHLRLRKTEPNLPRPYLAWGYPWTTILVLMI